MSLRTAQPEQSVVRACLVGMAVLLGLSGCWQEQDSRPRAPETDRRLTEDIYEATVSSESIELATLTDFEWESVSFFWEGALESEVESETGLQLDLGGRFYGKTMLVFCDDGSLVKTLAYGYGNLQSTDQRVTYSQELRLQDGGFLVEPSGGAVVPACTPDNTGRQNG